MPQRNVPLEPGNIYHIWTHAIGSENLFRSDENYRYFMQKYTFYIYPVVDTFAYYLMPNHLHLMMRVRKANVLLEYFKDIDLTGFKNLSGLVSQQFSNLFNAYSKAYNKRYNRKGTLFQRPFNRKLIRFQKHFPHLIAYIHYNPVYHGFVKDPADWPYNSWHSYLFSKDTNLNIQEAKRWFGDKKGFMKIHRELNFEKLIRLFEE